MSRAGIDHAAGGRKAARGVPASAGPRARIMVATPTYDGGMHNRYVSALLAAQVVCARENVELYLNVVAGSSLVQYARNQLLREFLADDIMTHLMWIDSDVGFDPRAIMQLLEHDRDVVGGVYPMKTSPIEWPYDPMPGEQIAGLHRAKVMPGGFLLCSRAAMQAVADRAATYVHHMGGMQFETQHVFDVVLENKLLLGEDVILSRRLIDAGFDVWVDPDINFAHCGQYQWRGNMRKAIEQGVGRGTVQIEHVRAIAAAKTAEDLLEPITELYHAWSNTFTPPPAELVTLALLARQSERILEAGSGLTTVVMAAANPKADIHSLEQEREWAQRVVAECRTNGLGNVTLHLTPLSREDWFYELPKDLPASFDLAVVDGPTFLDGTHLEHSTHTRRPFYTRLADRIANAVLVIDDIEHYRDIAARYQHEIVGNRFAICLPKALAVPGIVTSSAA